MTEITNKVNNILKNSFNFNTKKQLAEELGISRPTLDSRLSGGTKWKKLEIRWVNILYKREIE